MENTIYDKLHAAAQKQLAQTAEEKRTTNIWSCEVPDTNHFLLYVVPEEGKDSRTVFFANGSRRVDLPAGFVVACAVNNCFRIVTPAKLGGRKYRLYVRSKHAHTVSRTVDLATLAAECFSSEERKEMQRRMPLYRIFDTKLEELEKLEVVQVRKRRKSVYKTKIGGINDNVAEMKDTITLLQLKVERMEKIIDALYEQATGESFEHSDEIGDLL